METNVTSKPVMTTFATSWGGREGKCSLEGGRMVLAMARPKELAGSSATDGMNPEQLLAMGYASCYGQAINALGKNFGVDSGPAAVTCLVTLNRGTDGYSFSIELKVDLPGADRDKLAALAEAAHKTCPFSKAMHGNVPVTLTIA